MAIHHLLRHSPTETKEIHQTEGGRQATRHGLFDVAVHDLEILIVPNSVRPRDRLHIAPQLAGPATASAEGLHLGQDHLHLILEDLNGWISLHLQELLPRAVVLLRDAAHVVPGPHLRHHRHPCVGPGHIGIHHLQGQFRAVPEETDEHRDADRTGAIRWCLCKEHLNGLLAGGSVLQCQTGIHLSTLGKLVADRCPMRHLSILYDHVCHCRCTNHLTITFNRILIRSQEVDQIAKLQQCV
mmetsp:Transcript_49862/g.108635  ORF Transcript_49862/g.108635 Transcript_49862/m.108635 type:complete len:241 (-) Transcript_49862:278-1000(-)